MALLTFWLTRKAELLHLLQQHLVLVLVSTAIAVAIGIPAGIVAAKRPRAGRAILLFANIAQTIPSLALLGFILPLPVIGGIGPRTALVALSIYALLPVVRNTVTGIQSVDRAIVEAGVAMGMTPRQLLTMVEIPLAMPSIIAGVRVATVIGVGTTTIAAAIGAGGLGEYIFRGLSMVDTTTILAGAVPAAALALAADGLLAWVERRVKSGRITKAFVAPVAVAALLIVVLSAAGYARSGGSDTVVVGSKNFTEQVILGELVAQAIEAEGGVQVVRKLNLGGTFVCDAGLRSGDLDVYVEYTGTAVTAVFHEEVPHDSARAFERARELYARQALTVASPLGFNNTFTVFVRGRDAKGLRLRTIDDLKPIASRWTGGFGYEFLQRDDGYPGLIRTYGLQFAAQPKAMDLSLIYRALGDGQIDVIAGDATSAQIKAFDLAPLEDNRHYFPPYDAVPIVRSATLLRQPEVARALARLAGKVSDDDMRALNAAVDIDHQDVRTAVEQFLKTVPPSGASAVTN